MSSELVSLRRDLHRIPELGFEEEATSAFLRQLLSSYGNPRSVAKTGLVLDLGPEDAEKTLLLRADMDGLPIMEENDVPYASVHAGRMHACGHDAHMASLAVAGRLLKDRLPENLRLRLLFQPAEEGCGGAQACIEAGVLDGVDAAFGLHVWNELPVGTVALTSGGIMAGVVEVTFAVKGQGGHGALPDRAHDPVVALAELVMALQTVVSRRISPFEPAVLTLGSIQAGEAFNVIPDTGLLKGTIRVFSQEAAVAMEREVRRVAKGVAQAGHVDIDVQWSEYAKPTVNDANMAALAGRAAQDVPGITEVLTDYRTMAGEDFGAILEEVPGCYALVGSADPRKARMEPHHSPRFDIDERVLPIACALHEAVVAHFAT